MQMSIFLHVALLSAKNAPLRLSLPPCHFLRFGRGVFSDAAPELAGTNYTKGATDWRYVQQVHPQVPSREPAVPHLRVGCPTACWLTGTRVLGVQRDLALLFDGADWRTGEAQSEVGRDDRPLSSIPRRARINTSTFPEAGDTSWREADCTSDYCGP